MFLFALKTLMSDRGKLLIALLGVIFSLVLVNIQGGLFLGMVRKTTVLIDNGDAQIWVGHRGIDTTEVPSDIPESWINRIRGVPGVKVAQPYIVGLATAQLPDGDFEHVLVVGSDASSMMGSAWAFSEGGRVDLRAPDAISVDDFDGWRLGDPSIGDILEINGKRARVTAKTSGILGFVSTPYLFCTIDAARGFARVPEGYCSYYLIQAENGADLRAVCEQIRRRVPDVDVYTTQEFSDRTRKYWIVRTGLGMSFGSSTLLGLTVGFVMVAQSLYAFVLEHRSDYATLKAIGAEDRHVYSVLLFQGLTAATVGCAVGTLCTYLIRTALSTPYLTIETPAWLLFLSIGLATFICLTSSMLPFVRIRQVDPVSVLQE